MNSEYALIHVSGDDAAAFLQGQLTQDLRLLRSEPGLPAAWCNAKGRVVAVMRVIAVAGDSFALAVPRSSIDALVQRLSLFRLRARVDISTEGNAWLAAVTCSPGVRERLASFELLPEPKPFAARRHNGIVAFQLGGTRGCVELFGPVRAFEDLGLEVCNKKAGAWQTALIEAGIPHIEGGTSEKFTVHMLNLDLLGAISLNKGCYPGQEVIARTAHLGQSKRRLAHYRLAADSALPGARLEYEGQDAGEVVSAWERDLLAVVPLEMSGRTLSLRGESAVPVALPYPLPGVA